MYRSWGCKVVSRWRTLQLRIAVVCGRERPGNSTTLSLLVREERCCWSVQNGCAIIDLPNACFQCLLIITHLTGALHGRGAAHPGRPPKV